MSRVEYAKKNIRFGYIASVTALILGFVSRTIFIRELGVTYLGVNGLFASVLGVLSFAELGIGSAMNYSLYKPVAENNVDLVRSLVRFYRNVYRLIALTVTIVGLALLPFLDYIIKDPGNVGNIATYYVLFLFNNVVSYFAVFKTSLVNAEQKNYIISNINTVASIITVVVQIAALLLWGSYLGYLLAMSAMRLSQQIFLSLYLNRKYPHVLKGRAERLDREELRPIKQNIGALVWHKVGQISVYQTDNIIISAFISVSTVGLVSNYDLVLGSVGAFLAVAFGAVTSSFGNLIATGSLDQQYRIYRVYRFLAFWLYGFSAVALMTLFAPFITLWIGAEMLIPEGVVLLIVINYYMVGHRGTINNIKAAAGVWQPDKYVALAQAAVNLVVSIILVQQIGLPGVYLGTLAQGALATLIKPIIVYRHVFHVPAREYFIDGARYAATVALAGGLCWTFREIVFPEPTVIGMFATAAVVVVVVNSFFLALFSRTSEFRYVTAKVLPRFRR